MPHSVQAQINNTSLSIETGKVLWRAASDGSNGRALFLGIGGGVVGLAAIGAFTAAVVLALLWKSGT